MNGNTGTSVQGRTADHWSAQASPEKESQRIASQFSRRKGRGSHALGSNPYFWEKYDDSVPTGFDDVRSMGPSKSWVISPPTACRTASSHCSFESENRPVPLASDSTMGATTPVRIDARKLLASCTRPAFDHTSGLASRMCIICAARRDECPHTPTRVDIPSGPPNICSSRRA